MNKDTKNNLWEDLSLSLSNYSKLSNTGLEKSIIMTLIILNEIAAKSQKHGEMNLTFQECIEEASKLFEQSQSKRLN
jgi:hypothetical protein